MSAPFLTPSVIALLDKVNANAGPPDYRPEVQRAALNGAMAALGWSGNGTADELVDLDSGATIHIYLPDAADAASTIVYIHGGSFIAGGASSHGPLARSLADRTGRIVALVDYRLAPEHLAPAACDDCVAAVRKLAERGVERLAIVGDSAGGALAAATALAVRGSVRPALLFLINPMISPAANFDGSLREYSHGFFAGADDFAAGWDAYRGGGGFGTLDDLLAFDDLPGLPPTIILTNEVDPVRDQGEHFAEKLSAAGITTLSLRARGLIHAAWLFPKALPEAELLLGIIAGSLRTALGA
ncbi:alpha/beta hydrolase fold domain-containing protein [Sphingomonas sp. MMS24-J45]|uniref:alpha/beta hydrolase fold domain-containing protein n=1 Tax=Sphingomonas sp. MMS24-J45 TaxID=3238806 RepID=UPI00384D66B3